MLLFLWRDILGLCLKALVRVGLQTQLAYRALHIADGVLVLEDAVLLDVSCNKSGYFLRANTIRITWEKALSFFVHFDQCNVTISRDAIMAKRLQSTDSFLSYRIEVSEGTLHWSDQFLPSSTFSWIDQELAMKWKKGATLLANKNDERVQITLSHFPLHFLLSQGSGVIDGTFAFDWQKTCLSNLSLQVGGKDLLCDLDTTVCRGSFVLDWSANEISAWTFSSILSATNRFRLEIDDGSFAEEFTEGKGIATFQSGLGGKWEAVAKIQDGLPLTTEGKILVGEEQKIFGEAQFGKAELTLQEQDNQPWVLSFKGLGAREIAFMQKILATCDSRFLQGKWVDGIASGKLRWDGKTVWQCEKFQVSGLQAQSFDTKFICQDLCFEKGDWCLEGLSIHHERIPSFQGSAKFSTHNQKGSLDGVLERSDVHLFFEGTHFSGTIGEFIFVGEWSEKGIFIPKFEGKIPSWLISCYPDGSTLGVTRLEGFVTSLENGFSITFDQKFSLACKFERGDLDFANAPMSIKLSDLHCSVYADPEKVDVLSVKGVFEGFFGNQSFTTSFIAPKILCNASQILFDLRASEEDFDFCRIVGKNIEGRFEIDSERSFFLGEKLLIQGMLQEMQVQTEVPWPLLESFLRKKGYSIPFGSEFDGRLRLSWDSVSKEMSVQGIDSTWRNKELTLQAKCSEKNGLWSLHSLLVGPFTAHCQITQEKNGWQLQNGKLYCKDQWSMNFEGRITDSLQVNALLDSIKVDLAALGWEGLQGTLEGKGCFSIHSRCEADLDVFVKDLRYNQVAIENNSPLYISITSEKEMLIKGVECKIVSQGLEAHLTTELLEVDWLQQKIKLANMRLLAPSNLLSTSLLDADREVVLFGNMQYSLEGSLVVFALQEAFLPIGGSVRHVKEGQISFDEKSYIGSAKLVHQTKEAQLLWKIQKSGEGQLTLQESQKDRSMCIDGLFNVAERALTIRSIEGDFAGVQASFRRVDEEHLVGSAQIDFAHLSDWIPKEVAEVFHDLEMGAGYELKGNLYNDFSFQGLFCGKEIDLFGYQLRSLMSQAHLSMHSVKLQDLLVSDAAGSLIIPEIVLQGDLNPWTINIPLLTIQDLRPSLLRKPGADKKPLTPLLVRNLTMRNFRGLLEDGKTYLAEGNLSFINSFKRGKSVFDLPTHLFGRLVGLDLELLIPVEGDLFFDLIDGYFTLRELKESFSEGRRSQFFLAEVPSRMSLRGNLEIFVRMKHFVLFAPTEAFMISVDGKLSDPQFHLQKKKI